MSEEKFKVFYLKNQEKKIEIKAISTKYGNKLMISTPFNQHLVDNIKKTEWEKTHSTFDNATKSWSVDLSVEAMNELLTKRNLISNYDTDELYNSVMSHILGIKNILQINPQFENTPKKSDNKFLDSFVQCKDLLVVDYEYKVDHYKGAFSQMVVRCNREVEGFKPTFIFSYSRKIARKSEATYGRTSSNPFGQLADFFDIPRSEFNEVLKGDAFSVVTFINKELAKEEDRIIKISATRMDNFQLPNYQNQYRVFNIATEFHETVTFTTIRGLVEKQMKAISTIEEEKMGGSLVWKCKTYTKQIGSDKESLMGFVVVSSGNNVKRSSIKVVGVIQVGSCKNSIIAFEKVYIKHTTNWEERFNTALQEACVSLNSATQVIQTAMEQELTYEQGCEIIDTLSFGLKTIEKIKMIRELVKRRLNLEMEKARNVWALSQSLSYIGSHEEEFDSIDVEPTENILEDLSYDSFMVMNAFQKAKVPE